MTGVGVVPEAGEHPSSLRWVFDFPLSHVAQVQIGSRLDGDVIWLFGSSMPLAFSSSSCSSLRAAFVAMSHVRVFADFLSSLPHRNHSGHPHRLYWPDFFALDFEHLLECLA